MTHWTVPPISIARRSQNDIELLDQCNELMTLDGSAAFVPRHSLCGRKKLISEMVSARPHVRFTPESCRGYRRAARQLRAMNGLMHCNIIDAKRPPVRGGLSEIRSPVLSSCRESSIQCFPEAVSLLFCVYCEHPLPPSDDSFLLKYLMLDRLRRTRDLGVGRI